MDRQGFFKHAAVYGLAILLGQAGGLILLPLLTHNLRPADFGVLAVLSRLAETVGTILLFGGFRQALLTFHQQCTTPTERREVVSSTLAMTACTCLAGGGLVLIFAGPISAWLTAGFMKEGTVLNPGLLRLAVLGVLLDPLILVPMSLLQARSESTTFVLVNLSMLVVRVALVAALVVWLGWGVAGVLAATALTAALYGVGLTGRELARSRARPNLARMGAMARFALPFVPGGLCFFLLQHGDRFFLLKLGDAAEVGCYDLGYRLGMAVTAFSLSPLYMVWSARMYAVALTPEAPVVFGRAFTRVLAAYLAVGLALCLVQDEVVTLMATRDYAAAAEIIPVVVLACFFQAAASLMDAGFYVRRRTGLKLVVTLVATVVMLLLYALLIPRLGGMGAALATLGGFAFLAGGTYLATQAVFPVRYEWGRVAALLVLTVALWALSRLLPPGGWSLAIKAGLWLAWPLAVWHGGLMSADEKAQARDVTGRGLTVLRVVLGRGRNIEAGAAPRPEAL